ncbi:hypothetical protein HOLleu_25378 [Holothuria leucospilota]|uniref:Uncharacterized protein n=1 Tax=Holothuria leucospilota TaxID=206669 RepID=A0A9Q1BSX3_HOLLE|nr:hypothetical protein HOLleu_25378 [Holothuria leucospilota]
MSKESHPNDIQAIKRRRSAAKGQLTRLINDIKALMNNSANLNTVKDKCKDIETTLEAFLQLHEEYFKLLAEDEDKDEAEVYRESVEEGARKMLDIAEDWAKSVLETEQEETILPDDSRSQVSIQNQPKGAAWRAVLLIKAEALKKRQELEQEELKLRQKREELEMNTELALAKAEEDGMSAISEISQGNSEKCEKLPPHEQESERQESKLNPLAEPWPEVPEQPYEDKVQPSSHEKMMKIVSEGQKQQRVMLEAIQMPPAELVEFDGDPLQFWPFMRSFENSVASSSLSENAKLTRLMRYCVGKAKQVIQGCSVMEPKVGYERALK